MINSLVEIGEGKTRHVHYRDSKLTFLLRDSLGGNAKTLIIANVSPAALHIGETLSTLKFAQRAKLIKNEARINEDSNGTLNALKAELRRLRSYIGELEGNSTLCGRCREPVAEGQAKPPGEEDVEMVGDGTARTCPAAA